MKCIVFFFFFKVQPLMPKSSIPRVIWLPSKTLKTKYVRFLLGCNWLHSVWTKSFVCKDVFSQGFHYLEYLQKTLHCLQVRRFLIPSQLSGRCVNPSEQRAIPSGSQIDQASSVRMTCIFVWTLHCIKKLLFQLASVRTCQQPIWTPLSIRSSFKFFPSSFVGRLM